MNLAVNKRRQDYPKGLNPELSMQAGPRFSRQDFLTGKLVRKDEPLGLFTAKFN
jgi:hypothetical protein